MAVARLGSGMIRVERRLQEYRCVHGSLESELGEPSDSVLGALIRTLGWHPHLSRRLTASRLNPLRMFGMENAVGKKP